MLTTTELKTQIEIAIAASIEAGEKIKEIYGQDDFQVEIKDDQSPLTIADQNAHSIIMTYLQKTPYPIISEEGTDIPYSERSQWDYCWIVDPLDGTKEFIKRNGEFTVNIALCYQGSLLLGVIYVPVKNLLYFGAKDIGAFKCEKPSHNSIDQFIESSEKLPLTYSTTPYRVVGSRSHQSEETLQFIEKLKEKHSQVELVSMGSSLKICLVAEGAANLYPRFAPTMEWDTAAGHAIAEAAGKEFIDYDTNQPMKYNRENQRNGWFIVRDPKE